MVLQKSTLSRLVSLVFFTICLWIACNPQPRRFVLTTDSQEAKDYVAKVLAGIENEQPFAINAENARQAVAADSNFAFAHCLASNFARGNTQAELDRALALMKTASEGERLYIEAAALARKNETDSAIAMLSKMGEQFPDERLVWMTLGQLQITKKYFREATTALNNAIAIDGSTPRAHRFLGDCYLMMDDYPKAREAYTTAIRNLPDGASPTRPYYGLMYTNVYEGKIDAALAIAQSFLDKYTSNGSADNFPPVWIWNAMARINLENGRTDAALQCYKNGYDSVPESKLSDTDKQIWLGRMHHGTARTLAKMGKYDAAWQETETVKKMIEQGGEPAAQFWPSYHYLAGYVKLESGDLAAAIEHLQQARGEDVFHLLLLARAYEKAGEPEQARQTYEKIVASTSNNMERALAYPEAKKKLEMSTAKM